MSVSNESIVLNVVNASDERSSSMYKFNICSRVCCHSTHSAKHPRSAMHNLSKMLGQSLLLDSGFGGTLVVGAETLESWPVGFRKLLKVAPTSTTEYEFGYGKSCTLRSLHFDSDLISLAHKPPVRFVAILDVVDGWLPMLGGTQFMKCSGYIASPYHGGVLLATSVGSETLSLLPDSGKDENCFIKLSTSVTALSPKCFKRELKPPSVDAQKGVGQQTRVLSTIPTRNRFDALSQTDCTPVDTVPVHGSSSDCDIASNVSGSSDSKSVTSPSKKQLQSSKEKYMPKERKLPKCLQLKDSEILKVHYVSHAPGKRVSSNILSCLDPSSLQYWKKRVASERQRIEQLCDKCKHCAKHTIRQRPPTNLTSHVGEFNDTVMLDLKDLRHPNHVKKDDSPQWDKNPYALSIVCKATGYCMFSTVCNTGEDVTNVFLRDWISQWGCPRHLVWTDNGSEFVNKDFIDLVRLGGSTSLRSPPYQPEAHSLVERMNRVLGDSFKRVQSQRDWSHLNRDECELQLKMIANDVNNTILVGGYSAMQRVTGRATSISSNLLRDELSTPVEPNQCVSGVVSKIVRLQNQAHDAYLSIVNDRKLRKLVKERTRPTVLSEKVLTQGTQVHFLRPATRKLDEIWLGPATVIGFNTITRTYFLDFGGLLIKRSDRMIRVVSGNVDVVNPVSDNVVVEELGERDVGIAYVEQQLPVLREDDKENVSANDNNMLNKYGIKSPLQSPVRKVVESSTVADLADAEPLVASPVKGADIVRQWMQCDSCDRWRAVSDAVHSKFVNADSIQCSELGRQCSEAEDTVHREEVVLASAVKSKAVFFDMAAHDSDDDNALMADAVEEDLWPSQAVAEQGIVQDMGDEHVRIALACNRLTGNSRTARNFLESAYVSSTAKCDTELKYAFNTVASEVLQNNKCNNIQTSTKSASNLTATDNARYTWEDLPEIEKKEGMERALADYSTFRALGDKILTREEVLQQDSGAEIFSGTWAHRAVVKDGKVQGKSRFAPRGFEQQGTYPGCYEAPTTSLVTHRALEGLGLALCWDSYSLDFARAFFQSDPYQSGTHEHEHFWLEEPIQPSGVPKHQRLCRKLLKDVPGLRRAPQSWFKKLREVLTGTGHVPSRIDAGVFLHLNDKGEVDGYVPTHVDDARGKGTSQYITDVLMAQVMVKLNTGSFESYMYADLQKDPTVVKSVDSLGRTWSESLDGTRISMVNYIEAKLAPSVISRERAKRPLDSLSIEEYKDFREGLGRLLWCETVRPEIGFELSRISSNMTEPSVQDWIDVNKMKRLIYLTRERTLFMPRLPIESLADIRVTSITDASDGCMKGGKSQGCYSLGLQSKKCDPDSGDSLYCPISLRSHRIRRVSHSSFDAECLEIVECLDHSVLAALLVEEIRRGPKPSLYERRLQALDGRVYIDQPCDVVIYTDSNSTITKVYSQKDAHEVSKRRRIDIADIKDALEFNTLTALKFLAGDVNPTDAGTKKLSPSDNKYRSLLRLTYGGFFDPKDVKL